MQRAARVFRNRVDNLDQYNDHELVERFRLNARGIQRIIVLVEDALSPATRRNQSLSVQNKVCIALRYLATGSFQLAEGDLNGVSQPTVSKTISEFLINFTTPEIINRFIEFKMDEDYIRQQKAKFHNIAGFPHIIGLVDGTHIQIKAPSINEPAYVNRQRYHSINAQIVCNADDIITNVVAMWPGSTHDSRILLNSGIRTVFEGGIALNGHNYILGDSGYACKPWCLTPYANVANDAQRAYNRSHKVTRSKIERVIGQLKRRWGVLHGEIRMKTEMVPRIIVACAILHNICKEMDIPLPVEYILPAEDIADDYNGPQEGLRYRDHVAATFFGRRH